MDCWKTNLSLYKLPSDHLGKDPKSEEELFITLMRKDTQSMTQIKRGQHFEQMPFMAELRRLLPESSNNKENDRGEVGKTLPRVKHNGETRRIWEGSRFS